MPTIIDPLLNSRRKSPEHIALWPFSVKREVRASRLCFLPPVYALRRSLLRSLHSFPPLLRPATLHILVLPSPCPAYLILPSVPSFLSARYSTLSARARPVLVSCLPVGSVHASVGLAFRALCGSCSRRALLSPHAWRAPSLWRFSLGLWEVGGDLGRVVSRGSRRSVVRVHAVLPPPRFAPWPASGFRALCGAPALMYVAPGLSVGEVGGAHGLLFLPVASARAGGRRCALVYGVFSFPGLGA
ncbi:hypothetical protein C8J57DRAFT_1731682 [Mycena rebaudengoi]|nr:hypothetical protein C8J57DRAFT_1731682 [Mycena rebaudengoi]